MNKQELNSKLRAAFAGITLGEGIGYFEANAIDDFIAEGTPEYQAIKNSHERENWELTAQEFEGRKSCANVKVFMDREGLLYFLPIFMSNEIFHEQLDEMISTALEIYDSYHNKTYTDLLATLTEPQRQCLEFFYAERVKQELEHVKTPFTCSSCGKQHIPWVKWNGVSPEDYLREGFSDTYRIFEALRAA